MPIMAPSAEKLRVASPFTTSPLRFYKPSSHRPPIRFSTSSALSTRTIFAIGKNISVVVNIESIERTLHRNRTSVLDVTVNPATHYSFDRMPRDASPSYISCEALLWSATREAYVHHFAYYPDFASDRRTADMALQHRLGLLPQRRFGIDSFDPHYPSADGPSLIPQFAALGLSNSISRQQSCAG